jgi:hypothetical protein
MPAEDRRKLQLLLQRAHARGHIFYGSGARPIPDAPGRSWTKREWT